MKLEQGKLVKWENKNKAQIVWMILDDNKNGVILHSTGNIARIGTICDMSFYKDLSPFIGNLNINSQAS